MLPPAVLAVAVDAASSERGGVFRLGSVGLGLDLAAALVEAKATAALIFRRSAGMGAAASMTRP